MTKSIKSSSGFTLIELLTVIAIIGILAAIIIPTVSSVKISANKAKTKAQFGQWSVGMAAFKQEYGYFPPIHDSNKLNSDKLAGALTGRNLNGSRPATQPAGNTKGLSFYSIADSELNEARNAIVDAFGNDDIAVYTDTNGDGIINAADGSFSPVRGIDETTGRTPTLPAGGVRAGVVFYSAGRGASNNDVVTSW